MNIKRSSISLLILLLALLIVLLISKYNTKIENMEEDINKLVEEILEVEESFEKQIKITELQSNEINDLQATIDDLQKDIIERDQVITNLEEAVRETEERVKQSKTSRGTTHSDEDMRKPSGISEEQLNNVLKNTDLEGLAKYYLQAERDYGINAKFLASISIHESGWGSSNIAKTKNNLFGFQAYTHDTSQAKVYTSYSESILHAGKYIAENYLHENGKHFNGYTIESVQEKYCASTTWARKVRAIMNSM